MKGTREASKAKSRAVRVQVRSRLQKHIADGAADADYAQEELFVTVSPKP